MENFDGLQTPEELIEKIQRKEKVSSYSQAISVFELFRQIVSDLNCSNHLDFFPTIEEWIEKILRCCYPHAIVCDNVARRVYNLIHEEYLQVKGILDTSIAESESFQKMFVAIHRRQRRHSTETTGNSLNGVDPKLDSFVITLRDNILTAMDEYKTELETSNECIAKLSSEHIHTNETIMTYGYSRIVERFLRHAAQRRKFNVFVAEAAPTYAGHKMADLLSNVANINVTLIPDSAIFSCMTAMNKAIISSYAIAADGSTLATAGINAMALSSAHYNVPLLVCCQSYKLSPLFFAHSLLKNDSSSDHALVGPPEAIWQNNEIPISLYGRKYEQYNPQIDLISSRYIQLVLMNFGAHSTTYLYRHVSELYNKTRE